MAVSKTIERATLAIIHSPECLELRTFTCFKLCYADGVDKECFHRTIQYAIALHCTALHYTQTTLYRTVWYSTSNCLSPDFLSSGRLAFFVFDHVFRPYSILHALPSRPDSATPTSSAHQIGMDLPNGRPRAFFILGAAVTIAIVIALAGYRRSPLISNTKEDVNCARDYEACGAIPAPVTGSRRCCNPDFYCFRQAPYFSQCRPRATSKLNVLRSALGNLPDTPAVPKAVQLIFRCHCKYAPARFALRNRVSIALLSIEPSLVVIAHPRQPILLILLTRGKPWSKPLALRVGLVLASFWETEAVWISGWTASSQSSISQQNSSSLYRR